MNALSTDDRGGQGRSIGPVLRQLRRQRGLSLQQVSLATGISRSFLSQVETGTNDITFQRLCRVIDLYGVDLADLVAPPRRRSAVVVRAAERRLVYSPAAGIDVFLATVDTRRDLLTGVAVFEPRAAMEHESIHSGEEWVHIVRGEVDLHLDAGSTTIRLDVGDSAYLDAGRPHRLANATDAESEVITVVGQGVAWRTTNDRVESDVSECFME